MFIFETFYLLVRSLILGRMAVAAEILALRHQLAVLHRTAGRPQLRPRDHLFCVSLSKIWGGWREVLIIVHPETVVKWHRQGFKLYWRWKSQAQRVGRPQINREIRDLIRRISRENPTWGVAAHPSRASFTRLRCCGIDCREVPNQREQTSITDVEELSQ